MSNFSFRAGKKNRLSSEEEYRRSVLSLLDKRNATVNYSNPR
jgi:hypothetical protein